MKNVKLLFCTEAEKHKIGNSAEIFRIKFKDRTYVRVIKWKIKKKIQEHKNDIKFNRKITFPWKQQDMETNFENVNTLTNYVNSNCALKRK